MYTYNDLGQILALFIVTNAAAETAVGLSLLIVSYRVSTSINYETLVTLRD
jgi:NADH:ubiquinone oxidoreductase subunit K